MDVTIGPAAFELLDVMCDDAVVTVTDDCVLEVAIGGSAAGIACVREVDGPGTGHEGGG